MSREDVDVYVVAQRALAEAAYYRRSLHNIASALHPLRDEWLWNVAQAGLTPTQNDLEAISPEYAACLKRKK